MQKLILKCSLSPGDIVTLTAAVRDLHLAYPGEYVTDVRTPCPALWENNPHITRIEDTDPDARVIVMEYPLIHRSNQEPVHFITAYTAFLAEQIGRPIRATAFKGDIYLSDQERGWMSQVEEAEGKGTRFWIIVSGGKTDFTAKWWDAARWQGVVDHFAGRIRFVQVGEASHKHPALRGVLDLRGKTDLRQLVRLVYHADGVLCPVTSLMHLAAAVPWKHSNGLRPCVVVAGGREPSHWERYPGHAYLDTIGQLPCCDLGGCWKSRVVPLGDGSTKDKSLCERPVLVRKGVHIPACLDRITAQDVIRAVDGYLAAVPEKSAVKQKKAGCCGAISNAVSAVGRVAPAVMAGDEIKVEPDVKRARHEMCLKCEHLTSLNKHTPFQCALCNCFIGLKTALATESCPAGKWRATAEARKYGEVGLVIGTFAAVPYIHLQLETARRFYPDVPILIHDDSSKASPALKVLCEKYGTDFASSPTRNKHFMGDLSVFIAGLEWAGKKKIRHLLKLSRRWIWKQDFTASLLAAFNRSTAPAVSSHTVLHGFGFCTECVALDVSKWNTAAFLGDCRRVISEGRGCFVEAFIHQWAQNIAKHEKWKPSVEMPPDRQGYEPWPEMMGTSRGAKITARLWHGSDSPDVYAAAAKAMGLNYTAADFADPNNGEGDGEA